jgi:hypothetical protein
MASAAPGALKQADADDIVCERSKCVVSELVDPFPGCGRFLANIAGRAIEGRCVTAIQFLRTQVARVASAVDPFGGASAVTSAPPHASRPPPRHLSTRTPVRRISQTKPGKQAKDLTARTPKRVPFPAARGDLLKSAAKLAS